jgi:hypothetical protein
VFFQDEELSLKDKPVYTVKAENSSIYQRCSKFVFLHHYYPDPAIKIINLQVDQRENQSQTNIFGTKILLTLGVEILGKQLDSDIFTPFLYIK